MVVWIFHINPKGKVWVFNFFTVRERNGLKLGEHIEAFSTADIEPIVTDLFEAFDNDALDDDELRQELGI